MLKKTITYTNFNDEEVTEDFYFSLDAAELAELEYSMPGGLVGHITEIMKTGDQKTIYSLFKKLLVDSVGQKSEDGRKFRKNAELREDFVDCGAYSELFLDLVKDPMAAASFIKNIMPASLAAKIDENKIMREGGIITPNDLDDSKVVRQQVMRGPKTLTEYTQAELDAMPLEELNSRIENGGGNVPKAALMTAWRRISEK